MTEKVRYIRIEVSNTPEGKAFLDRVEEFCNQQVDKNAVEMQIIGGIGKSID